MRPRHLELARLVADPDLADKPEDAFRRNGKILALEIAERETILAAFEDALRTSPNSEASCSGNTPGGAPRGSNRSAARPANSPTPAWSNRWRSTQPGSRK
jgi:hypothetical protein